MSPPSLKQQIVSLTLFSNMYQFKWPLNQPIYIKKYEKYWQMAESQYLFSFTFAKTALLRGVIEFSSCKNYPKLPHWLGKGAQNDAKLFWSKRFLGNMNNSCHGDFYCMNRTDLDHLGHPPLHHSGTVKPNDTLVRHWQAQCQPHYNVKIFYTVLFYQHHLLHISYPMPCLSNTVPYLAI